MDESIKQELEGIKPGAYLMITGDFGKAINATIEQGELKSIQWSEGTLILHDKTYNRDTTVKLDEILFIDTTRTGSGALGAAQAGDWKKNAKGDWYKTDA